MRSQVPTAIPDQASDTTSTDVFNGDVCDAHNKLYQSAKWMLIITLAEVNILLGFLTWKFVKGSQAKPAVVLVVVKKEG